MRTSITSTCEQTPPSVATGWLDRLARRALLAKLGGLRIGELVVCDRETRHQFGRSDKNVPLKATVTITDPRFFSDVAFGGTIGAGEAYMRGYWTCDNLLHAVQILLRNRDLLDGIDAGLRHMTAPAHKLYHWLHRNTRRGSRRNIEAHYDLGNAMFELFLDETMMYSCAIFEHPGASLQEASVAKLERVCRKLELGPTDHVLEIGTGWGGFAIHAAKHYGCRVTTTTISPQQYALACKRVAHEGLEDRVTVVLQDYRELSGSYDRVVSIETVEAIGHAYLDTYFQKCSSLLKPDGMMLLQSITIADQRYGAAKRSVDFIQRHIFPGGFLPAVSVLAASVAGHTDMRLFNLEDIGPHYATTLNHWRERFLNNVDKVRVLGYPEEFVRMWEFYLCYCEGGFLERAIGTVQMLLTKPLCRRSAFVPVLQTEASGQSVVRAG